MNIAENSALLKRDPTLPGLQLVLDPFKVQEFLRFMHAIRASEQVELDYIRYKPGRRALSLMHVIDSTGSRRPIVVTACDYEGWNKVIAGTKSDDRLKQHSFLVSDVKSYIDWFPSDSNLRQANKLFDASKTTKILRRLVGNQHGDDWQLDTLAYKPNRRLVLKATSGTMRMALKCYASKDFPESCEKICHVANAKIDFCTPTLLGSNDRYSMIASQWIEGEVLKNNLADSSQGEYQLLLAGELLARWHSGAEKSLEMITDRHSGFSRNSLTQLVQDIHWLSPEMGEPLRHVMAKIDPYLDRLSRANDLIHGDFYAKQILVQGHHLHLIDFDEIGRGHRYQDLGTFIGNLYWNSVSTPSSWSCLDSKIEAFINGYEGSMGRLQWPTFQTCVVAGILRCVPHAFRRGLPDWNGKMLRMLDWASQWCPESPNQSGQHTRISRPILAKPNLEKPNFERPTKSDLDHSGETAPFLNLNLVNRLWGNRQAFASDLELNCVSDATLLRHKAGRRLLVEYTLRSLDGKQTQVIGKSRIRKQFDNRVLQLQCDLLNEEGGGIHVPRVLGVLPSLKLWFQEKVVGECITPTSSTILHRKIGESLAKMHSCAATICRSHSIQDEMQILEQQFEQWLTKNSVFAAESKTLLQTCFELTQELNTVEQTILHRDFYFDQVLACERGITILDFDLAAVGAPELDVGNYLAHLDEYGVRNADTRDQCQQSAKSFLAGYLCQRPSLDPCNVEVWRYMSLARLTAISQRIAERCSTTLEMLELCNERYRELTGVSDSRFKSFW